jgi:1-deoxy-D-xylulose-5-phosphate reductoisomerase
MKKLSILGSTGSIGTQTLDVVRAYPGAFEVVALTAHKNVKLLIEQAREFHPPLVCLYDEQNIDMLKSALSDSGIKIVSGMEGLTECAAHCDADMVLSAVVGTVGILPVIEAIKQRIDIAFANKETLVAAGHIIMPLVRQYGVAFLPVDSEHSAIFQCLQGNDNHAVRRIILTASGGPFRRVPIEDFDMITPEMALRHPNWSMGAKITIDSATMVNKGLEVIEAMWLFGVRLEQIEVVIQPQSVIHSAVEFIDGSVIAQMGPPDMKLPILYALFYPHRQNALTERLDFAKIGKLEFESPDYERFPALRMAIDCARRGGSMPAVFTAANDIAVKRFLAGEIRFTQIPTLIKEALDNHTFIANPSLETVLEIGEYLSCRT